MIKFHYAIGATPLDPDESEGLIPQHITTQAELNEWEQANIVEAEGWVFSVRHLEILTINFVQRLHMKMFNNTWRWAGQFRQSNKNIGVDYVSIREEIKKLLDDIDYQVKHQSYSLDEIAVRFHHRLVAIHPFANGNGRHARLMTDLLLLHYNQPRFSWGMNALSSEGEIRKRYITALQKADRYDYLPLLEFVRSI